MQSSNKLTAFRSQARCSARQLCFPFLSIVNSDSQDSARCSLKPQVQDLALTLWVRDAEQFYPGPVFSV